MEAKEKDFLGEESLLRLLELIKTELSKYVKSEEGKGLSANDFTTELCNKLNDIDPNAIGLHVNFKVVSELPTENIEEVIYLVPSPDAEGDNTFDEYIYIDGAWEKLGNAVVKVNLDEYVKKTDYATRENAGVARVPNSFGSGDCWGVMLASTNKNLMIRRATNDIITARVPIDYIDSGHSSANMTFPICPANLDYAVVQVLTNYKGEALTDEEKAAAQSWLGITDAIGDISSALDELHTYAQSLAGGDTE